MEKTYKLFNILLWNYFREYLEVSYLDGVNKPEIAIKEDLEDKDFSTSEVDEVLAVLKEPFNLDKASKIIDEDTVYRLIGYFIQLESVYYNRDHIRIYLKHYKIDIDSEEGTKIWEAYQIPIYV